jgi:DNA-binding MarR family transcriptional regulator
VWLSEDQQRVWRNYLEMSAAVQAALNRQLQRDCGLSLADYDVLVALDELAACRVNDLGARLGWEQSRVSHQLRRMQSRELIVKRGADDDRRAAVVELSEGGRAALTSAAQGHVDLVRALVFHGVGASQLRVLDRWTSQVLERLRNR